MRTHFISAHRQARSDRENLAFVTFHFRAIPAYSELLRPTPTIKCENRAQTTGKFSCGTFVLDDLMHQGYNHGSLENMIHPTAVIDPKAEIHPSVVVGPYSV